MNEDQWTPELIDRIEENALSGMGQAEQEFCVTSEERAEAFAEMYEVEAFFAHYRQMRGWVVEGE